MTEKQIEVVKRELGRQEKCEIVLLGPPYFENYWPFIEKEMNRIPQMWEDRISKDGLYNSVMHHLMQVWAVGPKDTIRMVVFTQIVNNEVTKTLQVMFAFGGSLEEVLPILDATLERFAYLNGCQYIDVIGRKGWFRMLRPLGFELDRVVMRRQVKRMELM